ncbi:hexokinase, partial [Coemansia erecta]
MASSTDPRYVIDGATVAQQEAIDSLTRQFLLTDEKLAVIIKEFRRRMEEGLTADGKLLKMIPSYVSRRPTGTETGS